MTVRTRDVRLAAQVPAFPKHQAKIYSHFYPLWGIAFARVLGYPYSQKDSTVMLSAAKHLDRPFAALRACPERSEWGDKKEPEERYWNALPQQEDSTVMLSAAKHLDAHPLSPYGILDLCLRLMHIGRPWCQPTEGAASPSLTSATSSYS